MTLRKLNGASATPRLRRLDKWLLALWLMSCALVGCASIGRNLTDGATASLGPKVPALTHDAAVGARDALAEPETLQALIKLESALLVDAREGAIGEDTKQKLQVLLDASLQTLRAGATDTEKQLGDDLVKQVGKMRDQALGPETGTRLEALTEGLIGEATRDRVGALLDSALSNERLGRIRDQLLGNGTRDSVNNLIAGAISTAADSLAKKAPGMLQPFIDRIHEEESKVTKLLWLLLIVAIAVVVGIAVVVHLIQKHRRVIRVVTKQIEANDNQQLKHAIKQAADSAGVEDYLHMLLKQSGVVT
jgi:hypothetical protein